MRRFLKKHWAFMAVFLLLGACAALWMGSRWRSSVPAEDAAAAVSAQSADPIAQYKTQRQQMRAMEKAQLNEIAHGAEADDEIVRMAQQQLLELCEREEQETTLEGMLMLRGWENAVVSVGQDSVNVLLPVEIITRQESSVILDLVCRETGVDSGNVKIIPIN